MPLIWSKSSDYQKATGTDGVSAWTWQEPTAGHGWVVLFGDQLVGAGHVDTAEEAQRSAELCAATRIAADLLK